MALANLNSIVTLAHAAGTRGRALGAIAAVHLAAFALMAWTEYGWFGPAMYLLAWALLNFSFLLLMRRPGLSAALSLCAFGGIVLLS